MPPAGEALAAKVEAARAYRTQIGFQFGGSEQAAVKLAHLTAAEGQAAGLNHAAERFAVSSAHLARPPAAFQAGRQRLGEGRFAV